jgi:gliding motility-associated-like protein
MKQIKLLFAGLFLASLFIASSSTAQTKDDKSLIGFDEKAAKDEMKRKKVPVFEQKEYMQHLKNKYINRNQPQVLRNDPSTYPANYKRTLSTRTNNNCNNIGFEDSTFNNWTGATGTNINPAPTVWNPGLMSIKNAAEPNAGSEQTILTIPPVNNNPALGPIIGYDVNAINTITGLADIPYLAPGGGKVSIRLGNSDANTQTEKLDYSITVSPQQTELNYKYAVVLNNATNSHTSVQQPYFHILLLDSAGRQLGGATSCNEYSVAADSAASNPSLGFLPYNAGGGVSGFYKKWTNVSVDLSPYMGRTITVEFVTAACTFTVHYGYAYIDASCGQLRPITGMCPGDSVALLVAPVGYASYQWLDTLGHPIPAPLGTNDSLLISHGHPGNIYSVQMLSFGGCPTTLRDTLQYSKISALGTTSTNTCFMGHTGTASVVASGGVFGYAYKWTPCGDTTQTAHNLPPGTYTVHVSSIRCTTSSFDTTVTLGSLPPRPYLNRQDPICKGDTFSFAANTPPGYPTHTWWMPPNLIAAVGSGANTSNYISQQGIPGNYRDTMRDANACLQVFNDSLYIVKVTTSLTHLPEHCYMDSTAWIMDNSSGGVPPPAYSYKWTGPASFAGGTTQTISNLRYGWYYVTTREIGHSCVTKDSLYLVNPPKPKDSLNITSSFCDGDTATALHFQHASGPYTWYHNGILQSGNADTLTITYPAEFDQYTVTYFANGCRRHDTLSLRTPPPPPFEPGKITNVFSPNKDNKNDLFFPYPKNAMSEQYLEYYTERYHAQIFDRWGVLMFNTHNFGEGWNGKYQGKDVPEGTYYWITYYTPRCIAKTKDFINKGFLQIVK